MRGSRGGIGGPDPPPPEHLELNVFLYKKAFGPPPPQKNGTPSESLEKHIDKKRIQGCFLAVGTGFRWGPIFPGGGGGGGGGGGPNAYFYRNTYNLRFSGPIAPLTKISGSARD